MIRSYTTCNSDRLICSRTLAGPPDFKAAQRKAKVVRLKSQLTIFEYKTCQLLQIRYKKVSAVFLRTILFRA